ncbi:META domain-containing protein [Hymenobacter bucti]|uniref:META domain-containing protein n=1 Tax=Hymenobacter bucti TaxID=1844114 RepID=A0ABW4QRF1_9BACT
MNKQLTLLFLYLGAALALSSCQDDPEPTDKLLNTRWMLVQIDAFPLVASSYYEDNQSYIQFAASGQRMTGLAACDAISGQFTLSASARQLTISQVTTAKGSCTSPVIGPRYLATLPQTSRYEISGDKLRLYDAQAAQPRLIFQAAP